MSDNVLSSFTPTRREERAYDHTFRVGIIGTGWIAEAHAESYLNQPDVKIVALADLIPQLQKRLNARETMTQIGWLLVGIVLVTVMSRLAHSHGEHEHHEHGGQEAEHSHTH